MPTFTANSDTSENATDVAKATSPQLPSSAVINTNAIMRNVWFKGAPLLFVYIINAFLSIQFAFNAQSSDNLAEQNQEFYDSFPTILWNFLDVW